MIKNIRHIGIVVEDLEASLNFYQNILGFVIQKQMVESGTYIDNVLATDGVKVTTIKMTAPDGQLIELLFYHSPFSTNRRLRQLHDIGLSHLAFTVEDLDRTYDKLKNQGIRFNAPPQISPDGYAKVTFCRAPEGTYVELVEVL
jgi:catechol 2,3-dioxygenase-like lactoylglutathione lyase family enzyme